MRGDLEIRHCRVLVAVADAGGITAAARALGLAQSTVSETLLSLERAAGVPMTLRRPGAEAVLTSAAHALLPHARTLIAAAEAALWAISANGRQRVRIGAIESVSSFLLPTALGSLRERWPMLEVQVTTGICGELRDLVHSGHLDAALTMQGLTDPPSKEALRIRRLTMTTLQLVGDGQPPREALTRTELAAFRLLVPDPEGALNLLLEKWLGDIGLDIQFESAGSIDGVKRGVAASGALGVLPAYAVADEIRSGALTEWPVRDALPAVALVLTTRSEQGAPSSSSELIDQLARLLGPDAASANPSEAAPMDRHQCSFQ